ncbi:MAG: NADH-quinone oxidoreductase subunit NuoN [Gammaproteobacteria bacterium]|jgi:NADH-quinone oxidoreductase subunit N|nr:NADH-quinone oxidoreductase subunit NuoN [Gammaproteobacteria bacterium]MBT3722479.1 NADH-quinone oxidoreductase subunit NuoN [Gammaproteobacteria bacterium]MBT4196969.1 NADH-quinone oxidoreductase subunit NuoN [Gammaproteobacteria bacterium]MBT4451825.1 NADH-quinone oxidoreductase subunit NuoN [Gammaproteobacteria bacterium]MBT4860737.1 NADH-quinone oxidoreductase subunit NuoN [Gammaproteobacteria bacterium]
MTPFIQPNLLPALPEMVMLAMACLVLVVDLFLPQEKRGFTLLLSLLTLILVGMATVYVSPANSISTFGGSFILDKLAVTLKLSVYVVTFMVFVYSRDYLKDLKIYKGEYYVLGLFAVLGMMIMISAHSFLLIYLGLELLSLSLYAMIASNRDSVTASEAAMKYFVLGALASGLLLYGISMFYGISGTLDITELAAVIKSQAASNPVMLAFALTFIVVGLSFKLGAVPFHMWLPDVYQGAPTSVTLFIGTAPKIAGFAMAIRLLVDGMSDLYVDWSQMLIVLAVASMALGNIIAISQTNFKRMLAYSTISHVGFILLGLLSGTELGFSSAMFYTITYAITSSVAFAVLMLLNRENHEAGEIADLRGLNDTNPWYAALLAIALFSMAGVPPTVGFYAKLTVINSVIQVDMVWLALTAVLFSVIGLFYYLRVIKAMYFDKPDENQVITIKEALDVKILLSANGLSLLLLGLFPSLLMAWCVAAFA